MTTSVRADSLRLHAARREEPEAILAAPARRACTRRSGRSCRPACPCAPGPRRSRSGRTAYSARHLSLLQRVAQRSAELVAARLGDDVDDAAAEAAVLGRDAGRGDGRFLNRVLDVEVVRLTAQVLVDGHAVDHEQIFERHRAGDRVGAARAGRVHRRREQQRRVDVAVGRQRRRSASCVKLVATCAVCVSTSAVVPTTLTVSSTCSASPTSTSIGSILRRRQR